MYRRLELQVDQVLSTLSVAIVDIHQSSFDTNHQTSEFVPRIDAHQKWSASRSDYVSTNKHVHWLVCQLSAKSMCRIIITVVKPRANHQVKYHRQTILFHMLPLDLQNIIDRDD